MFLAKWPIVPGDLPIYWHIVRGVLQNARLYVVRGMNRRMLSLDSRPLAMAQIPLTPLTMGIAGITIDVWVVSGRTGVYVSTRTPSGRPALRR